MLTWYAEKDEIGKSHQLCTLTNKIFEHKFDK